MTGTMLLEARSLTKYYGDHLALDRLDLSVAAGEIICLLGANGAGKTTTLNLFLGFTEPSAGRGAGRRAFGRERPGRCAVEARLCSRGGESLPGAHRG